MIIKRTVLFILVAGAAFCMNILHEGTVMTAQPRSAEAQEAWQKEFEDVCSKTQDAMNFSVAELKQLVERCDKVQAAIAKLDESQKKVFTRRLKMCKDLYLFVIDTKESQK